MASAVIGSLRVDLGLNSAQFDKGLNNSKKGVQGFAKAAIAGFAAVTAAFAGAIAAMRNTARQADEMWKSSQSLGVRIDELGRLRHAAEMSGSSFATLQTGIRRASQAVSQSLQGMSNEATRALDTMGVALQNADGSTRSMSDIMGDVAEQFSRMPDGAEKTAMAMALFGRSGTDLIPMLNAGRKGLQEMGDEAERLGLVFDERTGRLAERFNDNLDRMGKAASGLANTFGAMLLPAAVAITDAIVAMQAPVGDTIAAFVEFGRYAGIAVSGLAGFFAPAILSGLATVSVAIGTTMVGAVRALTVAMLANPLGLLIGGIAAAVTAIFMFRDEISQILGVDIVDVIKGAGNNLIAVFKGAFDAIGAVWKTLPEVLGDVTISTANKVIEGVKDMVNGAIDVLNDLFSSARGMLSAIGVQVDPIGHVNFGEIDNPYAGAAGDLARKISESFSQAFGQDYIGEMTKKVSEFTGTAEDASAAINELGTELDGNGTGGGAAGGAKSLGSAADDTGGKLSKMGDIGKQVGSTLASGFTDLFMSFVDGGKNAIDIIRDLLKSLARLALNNLFQGLFGGMFGGGGGGILGGIFGSGPSVPGFANGTRSAPGGLAWVGERGRELVNLPRGSQVIPNSKIDAGAGGVVNNTFNFAIEGSTGDSQKDANYIQQLEGAFKNMMRRELTDQMRSGGVLNPRL